MSEEIRRRISALLRKAQSGGASEAEAVAAAERAAALMREHGMSNDDVEFDEAAAPLKTKGRSPRDGLWGVIGRCANSAPIIDTGWTPVVTFIGRAPGPEIAAYLVAVCNRAIDYEIERFKKTPEYKCRRTTSTRRQAVHDFQVGLVSRLRQRLWAMFAGTASENAYAEARKMMAHRFPDTRSIQTKARRVRFGTAALSGQTAGDRVQLSHGVNGEAAPRQIGRM